MIVFPRWHLKILKSSEAPSGAALVLNVDPWLQYSRVAACSEDVCAGAFLAAAVRVLQLEGRDGQPGGSRLQLSVCAGTQGAAAAACASSTIPVPADSVPGFVSVAFLRASTQAHSRTQHWVVGVYGFVFAVTAADAVPVRIELQLQSELRDQHFLKVEPLFYTFTASTGGASSSEVVTYLDAFERLRGNASLSAVYAAVVVPVSRAQDLQPPPVPELQQYTPPQAVWRLSMHRASYHVEAATQPGLPVYERTGALVAGNETTQLRVSAHAAAPFARLRAGFLASYEGSGLNHRLALPHAYGRYEMFQAPGSPTLQCRFAHVRAEEAVEQGRGLRLRLRAPAPAARPPWLLLQFEVPCRAPPTLPPALVLSCEASRIMPDPWQLRCPDADVVLLVLDTALTAASFHFLRDGALASEAQPPAQCLFLGAGASWVNSVAFASRPAPAELLRRLRRSAQLTLPQEHAPVASSWRRERSVLTLNPVENMRVELLFQRDPRFAHAVSVGVDDVQLAPVLSSFPPQRAPDALCALLRVPSANELEIVGLQTLIVDEHWRRLHVTVSLETQTACAFSAHLYVPLLEAAPQTQPPAACPAAAAPADGLQRVGCLLQTTTDNVRTAYAECQLEVPLGEAAVPDLGVVVRPAAGCLLGPNASLVAWLRPYTALYSCPPGQFRDAAGACSNCHDSEALLRRCPLGQRLAGCPALLSASASPPALCVSCVEGAGAVAQGAALWVASNSTVCAWQCKQGFFRVDDRCARCSAQTAPCPPGQRWQPCDAGARQEARCVPCDALRAANTEFAAGCDTRCRAGFYNDTTEAVAGRCQRCWDRAELVLHAGLQLPFFALFNCTATANARWQPCSPQPGARVVGSDPGAGTAADPFTGSCVLECEPGWRRRAPSEPGDATCVQCQHPRRVERGAVSVLDLEQRAFAWQPESCAFECRPPWRSTRARGSQHDTCVLCEHEDGSPLCPDGRFPAGPLCACEACEKLP
jgi:hypothetical protein